MNRFGTVLVCIACILIAGSADFAYCQRIGGTRPEVSRNLEDSLKKQVAFLCSESMKGRKAWSPEEKQAAKYIYDFMQNLGAIMLSPEDGDDFGMANPITGDTLYSRKMAE